MSVLDDLEFSFFHLMPYAPLPDGYKELDLGQAGAWAELVPDSVLRLFDDAGHLLLDESPAAVGAVAEFCK